MYTYLYFRIDGVIFSRTTDKKKAKSEDMHNYFHNINIIRESFCSIKKTERKNLVQKENKL